MCFRIISDYISFRLDCGFHPGGHLCVRCSFLYVPPEQVAEINSECSDTFDVELYDLLDCTDSTIKLWR